MSSGRDWGSERAPWPACAHCRYFNPLPQDIEAQLPGLRALSSAYAAVRADDGLCSRHERYVAASSLCEAYHRCPSQPQPA